MRTALLLAICLAACGAPPGPQGPEAALVESWGPASLVTVDGAVGLSSADAQAAIDEVSARTDVIAPFAAANRDPFCARVFGDGGGNFGGWVGAVAKCQLAGAGCDAIPGIYPCTVDDLVRSRVAGTLPSDTGWVFDPLSCRGMTVSSSGERGLIWDPAVGFSVIACNDAIAALMCCG